MAEARKMPRRSAVYEHFTCFKDAQGNDKAKCKYCGIVLGDSTKNGTTNKWTHVKICKARGGGGGGGESHPESLAPPPLLLPSGPGESSAVQPAAGMQAEEEASRDLARMITLDGYDPSVVDNKYFRSFLRRLNPQFEVPSRRAIDKMCSEILGDQRSDDLVYLLEDDDTRKVSLAVGQSKTIEPAGQVVYLTTHFIDHDWNLHRLLHDVFLAGDGDHYHFPLRRVPVVSLDKAVDHIVSELDTLCSFYNITYELFTIVGEMTGHIDHLKLKDRMEQEFGINPIYSTTYMDHVLHSIARCLLPDPGFAENISDKIKNLRYALLFREPKELLTQLGLLDDPWEYDERWYSCYCSLEILDQTFPNEYSKESTELLILLRTLWREIYQAIKRVSDSSIPTSNLCLQELFNVGDVLQSQLLKFPTAAQATTSMYHSFGDNNVADVLREALGTVHKAIQDSYLVWSIPLVLDPRYKLGYIKFNFERAFGSEAGNYYTSEATRKIKELYTTSYYIEDDDEDSDGSIEEMAIDSTTRLEQAWDEHCRSLDGAGQVGTHHAKTHADELDRYLEDRLAPRTESFDILNWWKENSSRYPTVARMARDALAMPTCSKLTSDQIAHVRSRLRGYHQRYGW